MSYLPRANIVVPNAAALPVFPRPPDGTVAMVLGTPEPAYAMSGGWYQGGQLVKASHGAGATMYSGFPVPTSHAATTAQAYARLFHVPSDVTQVYINIANEDATATAGNSLASNVAMHVSDPTASNKVGALIHDFGAQTVPGDMSYLRLGPQPPTAGSDGCFVVAYSSPASGGNISTDSSNAHGWYKAGSTTVNPFPVPDGVSTVSAFKIAIEYTTLKQRLFFTGDSLIVNSSGSPLGNGGFQGAWAYQLGPLYDVAIDINGYGGATLGQRSLPFSNPNLWSLPDSNTDIRVIALGANDSQFGDASVMATNLQTIIGLYQATGVGDIYICTVMPIAFYSGYNSTRIAYNALVRTNWKAWGCKGLIDLDMLIDPGQSLTALPGGLTSDGGSHLNVAGNSLIVPFAAARLGL